jgi:hypothetical protein
VRDTWAPIFSPNALRKIDDWFANPQAAQSAPGVVKSEAVCLNVDDKVFAYLHL